MHCQRCATFGCGGRIGGRIFPLQQWIFFTSCGVMKGVPPCTFASGGPARASASRSSGTVVKAKPSGRRLSPLTVGSTGSPAARTLPSFDHGNRFDDCPWEQWAGKMSRYHSDRHSLRKDATRPTFTCQVSNSLATHTHQSSPLKHLSARSRYPGYVIAFTAIAVEIFPIIFANCQQCHL